MDVNGPSRGYILEVYDGHFVLPDLGPIGKILFVFYCDAIDEGLKYFSSHQ